MTCTCPTTDPYACWSSRYDVEVSAVEEDGGPCMCDCHEGCDDDGYVDMRDVLAATRATRDAWDYVMAIPAFGLTFYRARRGSSSRAKQRRARRRRDIQLARKARRRGVCPCGDVRIDDPGPHLATCRYLNEEVDECPF